DVQGQVATVLAVELPPHHQAFGITPARIADYGDHVAHGHRVAVKTQRPDYRAGTSLNFDALRAAVGTALFQRHVNVRVAETVFDDGAGHSDFPAGVEGRRTVVAKGRPLRECGENRPQQYGTPALPVLSCHCPLPVQRQGATRIVVYFRFHYLQAPRPTQARDFGHFEGESTMTAGNSSPLARPRACLLTAAIALASLAACSDQTPVSGTQPGQASSTAAAAAVSANVIRGRVT